MKSPHDLDKVLALLGDIPTDEDDCIEEVFLQFLIGTNREDIWHWIEEEFDVTLGELL